MADAMPGPGRLAGRGRELAALRGWLAQARAGQGRLVVLAGPPGIEDPATELEAIRARVTAQWAPQLWVERLRLGARAIELATAARQPLAVLAHTWRIDAAYQLLDLDAVDAEISHIAQLARVIAVLSSVPDGTSRMAGIGDGGPDERC